MRKAVNVGGGLLLLVLIGYQVYAYATAETRVRSLCSMIHPGMTLAELRAFSSASGLGPAPESSGVRFMVERKTFGRYGCRLELADGVVQTARYDRSN